MPWKETDRLSERKEFIEMALEENVNIRGLCREFGITPGTGYKWLNRFSAGGWSALCDNSRKPLRSPKRTAPEVERAVLAVRDNHARWGGRKIRARLMALGHKAIPSASTITQILRRHGKLSDDESRKRKAYQRFEYDAPNQLWQMDFKGDFLTEDGRWCYPLCVLDDHSRFAPCISTCVDQKRGTVKLSLTSVFRNYGLPEMMLMDNGSPWGYMKEHPHSKFTTWLMRLGIKVIHGRPYHPQTQGKVERFNRSFDEEVISCTSFKNLAQCQKSFDTWREVYNHQRPHEALGMDVPASRYRPSHRAFPEILPPMLYDEGIITRKVDRALISYKGKFYKMGKAFEGLRVGLKPSEEKDGVMDVYFMKYKVKAIDLKMDEKKI